MARRTGGRAILLLRLLLAQYFTQNTNWGNVEKAINNLKKKVLNAKAIHEMPVKKLASLIQPSGYFNVKAKRLKSFIDFLMNDYHGSMEKLKRRDALYQA